METDQVDEEGGEDGSDGAVKDLALASIQESNGLKPRAHDKRQQSIPSPRYVGPSLASYLWRPRVSLVAEWSKLSAIPYYYIIFKRNHIPILGRTKNF